MKPAVKIRDLVTLDELAACVALQEATWGEVFSEKVPSSILKIGQRLGGVSAGAFLADGTLVGFVFGLTGLSEEGVVHWSDMLAVLPEFRGQGIGIRLKLYQRERLLRLGVGTIFWTFDPLEARNAWLNFRRLGGYCVEYVPNMYGSSDSPLHHGLPTDRLVLRWDIQTERVRQATSGPVELDRTAPDGDLAFEVSMDGEWPVSGADVREMGESVGYLVPVPQQIQALNRFRPDLTSGWRLACRKALGGAVAGGGVVVDIFPGEHVSHYLVVPGRSLERAADGSE